MSDKKQHATVSNPYSKRKKPTITSSSSSTSSSRPPTNQPHYPIEVDTGTTSFSQAFGNVNTNFQSQAIKSKKRTSEEISSSGVGTHGTMVNTQINHSVANPGQPIITATNTNQAIDQAMLQPHVLLVSTKQRGNRLLQFIRNVPYAYSKITPDYIMGPNRCALFLSFKYHNLHPRYIERRIAELKNHFDLRVLLCLVDIEDNAAILLRLNQLCAVNNLSLTLSWSEEEAARYLETFKAFEGKDASSIQKKKEVTYSEQVSDVLGSVRSVNKTDSAQLLSQFGNLKTLLTASIEEFRICPGIGEKKVRRLYDAFNKPFSSSMAKRRKEEKERLANIERDIAAIEEEASDEEEQQKAN